MGAGDTAAVCALILSGLDEDILEYICGMLDGDEEPEEMEAAVSDFLLSCEYCSSEEAALAKCKELFAELGVNKKVVDVSDSLPKMLASKTSMADADQHLFREKDDSGLGGRLVDIDEALNKRKKRKAEREAELRATQNMYTRIQAQRAAEEAALQNAVNNAVALRREVGAYTGAVEAKPFQLPNPGGGRDLLENATFTLVRGRCYGLIGRNGKGKSTLLKALASRAVGDIPPELTVHYVSQEVNISDEAAEWTPVAFVVHADVERRMLLAEKAELEQALRVAQTSKDTEVRRVEKLQWEARLEAQARTARATSTARSWTRLYAPRALLHPARLSVPSAPVCTLPRPCASCAPLCRHASPSSSTRCGAASSRGETARGTPSCTPRNAGACMP